MELNKGLNLNNSPDSAIEGQLYYAKNIILDETLRFLENEYGLTEYSFSNVLSICGSISFDKGVILFGKSYNNNNQLVSTIFVINTNEMSILYKLLLPNIDFTKENPIRGEFTYNHKGDYIIIFSSGVNGNFEDKIININNKDYVYEIVNDTKEYTLTETDIYKIDLNPNVQFPKISSEIISGTLNTGSYQISISYYVDGEYTNASLLSLPIYIYGTESRSDTTTGLEPNKISKKGIKYNFLNIDLNYNYFRITVIYNDGTSYIVRNSPNIKTNISSYEIKDLSNFVISSLNEALINSIFYSNSETLAIMDNKLYRANVKGQSINGFDEIAQSIATNVKLKLKTHNLLESDFNNTKSKQFIKFQNDEIYVLYLTLGDKKGNIIGSYPINTKDTENLNFLESIPAGIRTVHHPDIIVTPGQNAYSVFVETSRITPTPIEISKQNYFYIDVIGNDLLCQFQYWLYDSVEVSIEVTYTDTTTEIFNVTLDSDSIPTIVNPNMKTMVFETLTKEVSSYEVILFSKLHDGTRTDINGNPSDIGTRFINVNQSYSYEDNNYPGTVSYTLPDIVEGNWVYHPYVPPVIESVPDTYEYEEAIVGEFNKFNLPNYPDNYIDKGYRIYSIPKENYNDEDQAQYTINYIEVELPDLLAYTQEHINKIGFWCIHKAQRTNNNSKINCQGIVTAQVGFGYNLKHTTGNTNYVGTPSKYVYIIHPSTITVSALDHISQGYLDIPNTVELNNYSKEIRFYSFEDLFSKIEQFSTNKIKTISYYKHRMYYDDVFNGLLSKHNLINAERSKTIDLDILSQELIQGNNLTQNNLLSETSRILTLNNSLFWQSDANVLERCKIYRANVYNNNEDYYSDIFNETLILSSKIQLISDKVIDVQGDTFYSEFLLLLKRSALYNTRAYVKNSKDIYIKGKLDIAELMTDLAQTENVHTREYITFIESKYNIHARYWEGEYPKFDNPINTDTQIGYNKVYNLQNTENVSTIININDNITRLETSTEYKSRIIMSKTKSKETNFLNFRKYLALDYYDMPYNRDEIVALNATSKNLYIQQKLALSVASIKDVISYDEGTTYIGSGQLFDRLPSEVIPTKHGFIGCESIYNTGLCEIGVWIIDNINSRIFLITDTETLILTDNINEKYFKDKLTGKNPFLDGHGFITYDNISKRLLLFNNTETLSYYPQIKNWLSFHSYRPTYCFNSRDKCVYINDISLDTVGLYVYNESIKVKYFDNIEKSYISVITNGSNAENKLYESIIFNSKFILNSITQYDKTFNKIMIHNDSQCTGYNDININTEWWDKSSGITIKDLWLFNNMFDYVINNYISFLTDFIILDNNNIDFYKEWFDKSKIMSTFAIVTLMFDNLYYDINNNKSQYPIPNYYQPKVLLKDIITKFIIDNR